LGARIEKITVTQGLVCIPALANTSFLPHGKSAPGKFWERRSTSLD
jgi:hypothetical protein